MIDYIQGEVFNTDTERIKTDQIFRTKVAVEWSSGEVDNRFVGHYKNINIAITDNNRVFIKGSLHVLFNYDKEISKGYNHGDFSIESLEEAINELTMALGVSSIDIRLENVEFGVNIPYGNLFAQDVKLSDLLILQKNKSFSELSNKDGNFIGKRTIHTQYTLKIYEKGIQYKLNNDEVRIEIKVKRMEFLTRVLKNSQLLKSKSYLSLADLTHQDTLMYMGQVLLRVWNDTLLYDDSIDESKLIQDDLIFLCNHRNPLYWQISKFKENILRNKKRKYRGLVRTHSQKMYHEKMHHLIKVKWNELSRVEKNDGNYSKKGGGLLKKILTFFNHVYSWLISHLKSKQLSYPNLN